jgi:hypothetical protein
MEWLAVQHFYRNERKESATGATNPQITESPNNRISLIAFHNPHRIIANPANSDFSKQGT